MVICEEKNHFAFDACTILPILNIVADTGVDTTNWGAWKKTQSCYFSGVSEHLTNVQCG